MQEARIFANLSKYEYLKILIKLENQLKITNKDLIENLKNFQVNNNIKVKLFNPGEHNLKNISKRFLFLPIMSSYNEGDFINKGVDFEVIGDLPARLIEIDKLDILSVKKKKY